MKMDSRGYSLVELLVVMAIFLVVIGITSQSFNTILSQATTQTRISESNIEGVVGLELMRTDLDSAGFGLPWSFSQPINFDEMAAAPGNAYNTPSAGSSEVPRAFSLGNFDETEVLNAGVHPNLRLRGSDYLVIRATNIGTKAVSQRWSYMNYTASSTTSVHTQLWRSGNFTDTDRVIVVQPIYSKSTVTKQLVANSSSAFGTTYADRALFAPQDVTGANIIYGIDDAYLRMPFNRADYYVRFPAASSDQLPQRCAPNTGILFKATVNQNGGGKSEFPLLDCVADMQAVFTLDINNNGTLTDSNDISALSAQQQREQIKGVQVYVLTHEGRRDPAYSYPNSTVGVGPGDGVSSGTGRTFNLSANIGTGWQNYRWKVYRIVLSPKNLSVIQQ